MSEASMDISLNPSGYVEGTRVVTKANLDIEQSANRAHTAISSLEGRFGGVGTSSRAGFGAAKAALNDLESPLKSARRMLDQIESRIIRIGVTVLIFRAVGASIGAFTGAMKIAIDYLSLMETAGLGIASSFLVVGKYVDVTTGKVLGLQRSFIAAQTDSKEAIDQLRVANMNTIATLDQLVVAYQVALPVAIRKGFDKKQVVDFTTSIMQMAGAIGQPFDQMSEEIRSLLGGSPITKNSRMAQVLGLRPEDINQFKNDGQALFAFLMQKMQPFQLAGIQSQKTFKGLISNIIDIGKIGLGNAFEGVFTGLKTELRGIQDSIVQFNNVTKKATWNPEFIEKTKELGKAIKDVFDNLVSKAKFLYDHASAIWFVIKSYVQFWVVTKTIITVQGILHALTYQSIAATYNKNMAIIALGVSDLKALTTSQRTIVAEKAKLDMDTARRTALLGRAQAQEIANAAEVAGAFNAVKTAQSGVNSAQSAVYVAGGRQGEAQAILARATAITEENSAIFMQNTSLAANAAQRVKVAESAYTEALAKKQNAVSNVEMLRTQLATTAGEEASIIAKNELNRATRQYSGYASQAAQKETVLTTAKYESAVASANLARMVNDQASAGFRYLASAEATIVAQQRLAIAENELKIAKINAINVDDAAVVAANRHNAALRALGNTTDWVSAAQLRKVQTDYIGIGADRLVIGSKKQLIAVETAWTEALIINERVNRANSLSMLALSGAVNVLKGALNLVGGWIGLVTILLMAGLYAWEKWGNAAEKARKKASEELNDINKITEGIEASNRQKEAAIELDKKKEQAVKGEYSITKQDVFEVALGSNMPEYLKLQDKIMKNNEAIYKQELVIDRKRKMLQEVGVGRKAVEESLEKEKAQLGVLKSDNDGLVASKERLANVSIKQYELDNKNKLVTDPKKGKEGVEKIKSTMSEEKNIRSAYHSYLNTYYKELISIEKAGQISRQIEIDEAYRKAEMSQENHINKMHDSQKKMIQMDVDLDNQHLALLKSSLAKEQSSKVGSKVAEMIFDKDGKPRDPSSYNKYGTVLKPPVTVEGEKQTQKQYDAVNAYKEQNTQIIEQIRLSGEIFALETNIKLNKEKMGDDDKIRNKDLQIMKEGYIKTLQDAEIENLNALGYELKAFELSKQTDEYKRTVLDPNKQRLETTEAYLERVKELGGVQRRAAEREISDAKKVIDFEEAKVTLGGKLIDEKVRLNELEQQKSSLAAKQPINELTASQVGTNSKTGNIADQYSNTIAMEIVRHKTAVENMVLEYEIQQTNYAASIAGSDAQETAYQTMIELQKQLNQETIKHSQIKAAAGVLEMAKAYDSFASAAQRTWPKITAFQTAAKLATKDYADEVVWSEKKGEYVVQTTSKAKKQMVSDYTGLASEMFSNLADSEDQSTRQGFESAKAYNVAAAIMSTASGIMAQLAAPDGALPTAWARAALVGVMGAIQVAKIASTTFGGGGSVGGISGGSFGGSGGGASNSVGSSIGSPVQSVASNQTEEHLRVIADNIGNASIAMTKVSAGLTKIADLFTSGKFMNLASGGAPNIAMPIPVSTSIVKNLMTSIFGGGWRRVEAGVTLGVDKGLAVAQDYITEKKPGGWFSKNKYRTSYTADSEFSEVIQSALIPILTTIHRASVVLGTNSDVSSVNMDPVKIATSGRKKEDIQKDLQTWLETVSDTLAKTTEGLQNFAFFGENAFDALVRLSTSLQGVNEQFELIGKTLVNATLTGANAAWKLTDAFGGLDKFESAVDKYFTTMFTEKEQDILKAAQAQRQVNIAFEEMNFAVPVTRKSFVALVNSINVTTNGGAALYKALMDIVPAFDTLMTQVEKTKAVLISDWSDKILDNTKRMLDVAKQGAEFYKQSAKTLSDALTALRGGDLSTLSPEQKYLEARVNFAKTANLAKSGDKDSLTALPGMATAFATASKAWSPDFLTYSADIARISNVLSSTAASSTALGNVGDYQVTLLTNQVSLLEAIKEEQGKGVDANISALQELSAAISINSQAIFESAHLTAVDISGSILSAVNAFTGQTAAFTNAIVGAAAAAGPTGWVTAQGSIVSTATATSNLLTATGAGLSTTGAVATAINKTNEVVLPEQFLKMMQATVESTKGLVTYYQAKATYDQTLEKLDQRDKNYYPDPTFENAIKTAEYYIKNNMPYQSYMTDVDTDRDRRITNWDLETLKKNQISMSPAEGFEYLKSLRPLWRQYTESDFISEYNAGVQAAKDKYNATVDAIFKGTLPSYDVGSPYVPSDMMANIHQGEIIMDRKSSDILRQYGIPTNQSNVNNEELVNELKELRREVVELRNEQRAGNTAIARNTQETAKKMSRWDGDGMPPVRVVTA